MITAATAVLERNSLFRGLPAALLEQVGRLCVRRAYAQDAVVFNQSDPGDALFGVLSGRIRISTSAAGGREMFLNIMEPGDSFGEIALLDGQPRTATATAMTATELLTITRAQFQPLLARSPELTDHLLKLLCSRLRWVCEFAEESALHSVPARLARRLLSLGKLHGHGPAGNLELKVSQEEMAHFLGLSRQIVNQHLQEWKVQQWVALGRGRIRILNGPALEKLARS